MKSRGTLDPGGGFTRDPPVPRELFTGAQIQDENPPQAKIVHESPKMDKNRLFSLFFAIFKENKVKLSIKRPKLIIINLKQPESIIFHSKIAKFHLKNRKKFMFTRAKKCHFT